MVKQHQKAVLVTGASTGIGRSIALLLDRSGYRVFAGVRKEEDAEKLRQDASGRLRPLMLDITSEDDIKEAVKTVELELGPDQGLSALVNNAGIAAAGPLEFLPLDRIRQHLEVNVIGQIAMIQAFLPLLRLGRGRIIQIGSGIRGMPVPFLGAYVCSKAAMAAVLDTFRRELRLWKIPVSEILPGIIKTPMWEKYPHEADDLQSLMPAYAQKQIQAFGSGRRLFEGLGKRGHPPESVARVVLRALRARKPQIRYFTGMDAFGAMLLPRLLPDRALDWIIDFVLKRRS